MARATICACGKTRRASQQTPGGHLNYGITTENRGNIATHAWLTDTLPAGTSFIESYVRDEATGNWQLIEPETVTADYVVWDLGIVPVNAQVQIQVTLDIDAAATPGVIENCVEIGGSFLENTPADNADCAECIIYPAGPNLRVTKWHEWHDNVGRLQYAFDVQNIGDTTIDEVFITDTLPARCHVQRQLVDGTAGSPGNVAFTDNSGSGELLWELERLEPGWGLTSLLRDERGQSRRANALVHQHHRST